MKSKVWLIAAVVLLVSSARAQSLVYSLCYSETQATRQMRYPNGALGASTHDKLAMLRGCRKNEIYAVSLEGKRSLLFSDEGLDLEVRAPGTVLGDKAYVTGIVREWRSSPIPGANEEPAATYEVSLDGSGRVRRMFDAPAQAQPMLLNRQGTRAAIQSFDGEKYMVTIYDVPSWKQTARWELMKALAKQCGGCTPVSYGWMADGLRLFFNLTTVGDEEAPEDNPGIYFIGVDGLVTGRVEPGAGQMEIDGYVHPEFAWRNLVAELADGSYVYEDYVAHSTQRGKAHSFVVIVSPDRKQQRAFPVRSRATSYRVARSGRYIAYIEERQTRQYQTERHVWAVDLDSGAETELFAVPPPQPPTSLQENVALTVFGWIGDK
jgi:hypothetical protein